MGRTKEEEEEEEQKANRGEEEGEREREREREIAGERGAQEGQEQRENSIPRSIMQPVCRITAGTRFRFAPMKGLPCAYTTSVHANARVLYACMAHVCVSIHDVECIRVTLCEVHIK
jgi:IS5 family transposase